ncbi:MAG: response regulator transcription factor [Spirochaetales bacterium]|nr:response regulator transcription factor [Spirochaetales bacterium]
MLVENFTKTIKFMIIDDHPIFIQGLKLYLQSQPEFEIVGNAKNRQEAYDKIREYEPDFVIVDVSLKATNGISLVAALKKDFADLKILMLSMHDEKTYAEKALRAGANGYIMKHEDPDKLMEAIRNIISGQIYLSDDMKEYLLNDIVNASRPSLFSNQSKIEALSSREFETFLLMSQGFSPKQIAEELHLNVNTIQSYNKKIKAKFNLKTTKELRQFAVHWGLTNFS